MITLAPEKDLTADLALLVERLRMTQNMFRNGIKHKLPRFYDPAYGLLVFEWSFLSIFFLVINFSLMVLLFLVFTSHWIDLSI
jgi:hypothetical protein